MYTFKTHQIIDILADHLPHTPVIIEAGAYKGNDSIRMAQRWPQGVIHSFEPVPELFDALCNATSPYTHIHCYPYALSDTSELKTLYIAEKEKNPGVPTQAGSLHAPQDRLQHSAIKFPRTIQVQTIALDSWAQQYGINQCDLLWLDLQGHEITALQGATELLKKTSLVIVEVFFIQAYENHALYPDVVAWMETHNFVPIAKDFSEPPTWFFGNVLFARKGQ